MKFCQLLTGVCFLISAGSLLAEPVHDRAEEWAMALEKPGLPNLHQVSPVLFRSAQPSAVGMRQAKDLGVKTVLSLRAFHSDRDEIGALDLGYEHCFIKTWHPEEEDVVTFLKLVSDPARTPLLVHCQHGSDRTGMMCAVYRIAIQGWSKQDAVREMTEGDFGFHAVWTHLPPWIMALDIVELKRKAGL
jgi:protein tyrosine/serine phosphatase